MKKYFSEQFEDYKYDFIKSNFLPNRDLITCIFAFVVFKNKIYLTKNHRGWELPGGHIEKGESYDDALDRELAEEIGTQIKSKSLFGYKKITNFKKIKNRDGGYYPFPHSYILYYICKGNGKKHKINCPDTIDYGLFSTEEAKNKMDFNGNKKIIGIIDDFLKINKTKLMNGFKFEKALRILHEYYPKEDQKKPSLFHSVRVGTYLYNNGYSENLQIAGLLHDALEDTPIGDDIIKDNFGEDILQIIIANSKNNNLPKENILEDIVKKCVNYSESALIVKMADVYDNFLFYIKENNIPEIERCKYLSKLIKKYKPDNYNDKIFNLAEKIISH